MTYPELAALTSTADQDLGLTIAYRLNVLEKGVDRYGTPGAFLAAQITALLATYAADHVTTVQEARALAVVRADPAAAAAALHINLTVTPP